MFGKKKEKLGNHFVYSIYDTVSKKWRGTFYHTTDEDMIRISLPTVLMDYPLRDVEVWKIGTFDDDSGEILPLRHVLIPTNCYLFPHSRLSSDGDDLSPDEIDSFMKEQKNKIIAEISEKKNEQKSEVVNG